MNRIAPIAPALPRGIVTLSLIAVVCGPVGVNAATASAAGR
jgi:hypothetical protein